MDLQTEITKDLLEIEAVQIRTENYFTWTSGIKSPIYCDNRLTMSYPHVRRKIVKAFTERIERLGWKPDSIAGCATAGIPHAAWLAEALDLPMVYVRSSPKGHGKENQIEGHINREDRVIVIEDLISTGGSSLEAVRVLKEVGAEVLGVLAIFTYGLEKAKNNFSEENVAVSTITSYDFLLEMLMNEEKITEAEKNELIAWRDLLK
ncbi:MAG TPA: orotate phosphoribosyltransferase [Pseudogracilibacillus sp.]|nr:orotate phosphoribosyltransferase [Pseudogracilibacillus sp.]